MAKIEVVIHGDQVPAVRDLFIEAGATGYATATWPTCEAHCGRRGGVEELPH
ncbi:MAG: hypothetical protein ABR540_07360 [Acidimicrobiales bacterium]|nr:hypothetical protein [Actinomycetota bacterium]